MVRESPLLSEAQSSSCASLLNARNKIARGGYEILFCSNMRRSASSFSFAAMRTCGNWICWSRKELTCGEAAKEHKKSRPTGKSAIGFMGGVYQAQTEVRSPQCTIT